MPLSSRLEANMPRKDVSAAAVARSLVTGRFSPEARKEDDAPADRIDKTVAYVAEPAVPQVLLWKENL